MESLLGDGSKCCLIHFGIQRCGRDKENGEMEECCEKDFELTGSRYAGGRKACIGESELKHCGTRVDVLSVDYTRACEASGERTFVKK